MIDNLVVLLTHSLLLLTAWRLWNRDALDDDRADTSPPAAPKPVTKQGWNRPRA